MNVKSNIFRPVEYCKPTNVVEAIKLLEQYGEKSRAIAGGTDLLVEKDPETKVLVDITGLGLDYIEPDSKGVRIGATTTFAEIASSSVLDKSPYNILAHASRQIGTPQIRNLATIGGNVCNAVPSADSATALLALDATLTITNSVGQRSLDIADFFQDVRKSVLKRNELVTEIQLPTFPARTATAFIKKGRVATADLAVVNVAVRVGVADDNICRDVRIALGAVAPTPLRAKKAEDILKGKKLQEELLRSVASQASEEIKPIDDVRSSAGYRVILSGVLVERALKEAIIRLSA